MGEFVNGRSDPLTGKMTLPIQANKFGPNLMTKTPSDLKFRNFFLGVPVTRGPVKRRFEQTAYNSIGNNEMICRLPNDAPYDCRRGYLTFDLKINTTGGTYKRIAEGIWSIFYRMRTKMGFELENIFEYNRLYNMLWELQNDARQSSAVARKLMGIGTPSERNVLGATTSHYVCPLFSGLFDNEMLPLDMMTNIVELFLNLGQAETFVETDGTAPSIEVTNVRFHIERITTGSDFSSKIKGDVMAKGLNIGFNTYNYYTQALPVGTQSLNSITVNHKSASMKYIFSVFTRADEVADTSVNDKFRTWPKLTDEDQLRLNERLFPEERKTYSDALSAEAFLTYLNLYKKWNLGGDLQFNPAPVTQEQFSASKFVVISDLQGYPFDENVINPVGNDNVSIQMQIDVNIPVALAHNYRFDSFVHYFRQIKLKPGGIAEVVF